MSSDVVPLRQNDSNELRLIDLVGLDRHSPGPVAAEQSSIPVDEVFRPLRSRVAVRVVRRACPL